MSKKPTTVEAIKASLENKKFKFRENENDFTLNCPLCTDTKARLGIKKVANLKKKLEIGAWNCFNCNSNGKKFSSFEYAIAQKLGVKFKTKDVIKKEDLDGDEEKSSTLAPEFHKKFIKAMSHPKFTVKQYLLEERKLSEECIEHFELGGRTIFVDKRGRKKNYGEHLAIPYLRDGVCVNMKYRALDPNVEKGFKWKRETGGMTWIFNDAVIDDFDYDEIIIAESEIDAMSLWTLGYQNVIGLTAGAKGFKQAWYERLLRFKKIYLVLDADGAGQEGARLIARRLGLNRCFNVVLPEDTKDPNDFIKKYDSLMFQGLLDKSHQFDVPAVKSLATVLKDIYRKRFVENNEDVKGWEFPWASVQEKAGSIKPGHLVVIAGRPKVGKTTWGLDLTRRMAKGRQKVNVGMYSCEMNLDTLGEKLVTQVLPDLQHIDELTQSQILYAAQLLPTKRMHFYQPLTSDDLALDKVCTLIEEAVIRYGIKLFIFDNLHFLCRDEDEYTAIGKATQAFKLLAEKLRIGMILLTHPRKGDSNKKLKPDDLKGSSSIFQDADLVIMLNREAVDPDDLTEDEMEYFTGSLSPNTEVDFIGRWTQGGRVNMYFNEDRALFKDDGADFEKMREFMENKKSAAKK